MTLVLGVDGGGTRTRLVLADGDGRVLGGTVADSINLDDHPAEHAVQVLATALAELETRTGGDASELDAAFFCVGGVLDDADRRAVREVARAAGVPQSARIGISHDALGALVGGLAGREGMVVVAGTGSVCFGRTQGGREARCGNWGPLIGDEGSGYWLGREALRAVAKARDGRGEHSALVADVLAALALDHADGLLRRIHQPDFGRSTVAGLAPIVLARAAVGDPVAGQIVDRGCALLAECVQVVRTDLFSTGDFSTGDFSTGDAELTTTGGLTKDSTYMRAFEAQVARRAPGVQVVAPILPPVLGAVRLALELAECRLTHELDARLAAGRAQLSDDV